VTSKVASLSDFIANVFQATSCRLLQYCFNHLIANSRRFRKSRREVLLDLLKPGAVAFKISKTDSIAPVLPQD
jgi:hypothetical protein